MKNPIPAISRHVRLLFAAGALASVVSSSAGQTVFSDNFNRSDVNTGTTPGSTAIGNGWTFQSDTQTPQRGGAQITGNTLQIGQTSVDGYAGTGGADRSWLWQDTSTWASPYNTTLANNPEALVWTFNMRTGQSNPTPVSTSGGGTAVVVLATAETGTGDWQFGGNATGYLVTYNSSSIVDPIKLVRMTNGVRNEGGHTTLISATTAPFNDIGDYHLSVKVTYDPSTNKWNLYARDDGNSFQDPATGTLTLLGSAIDSTYTGTALPYMGFFGNSNNGLNSGVDDLRFDNLAVSLLTKVEAPVFSAAAGTHNNLLNVTITATPGSAEIRYTTDGSDPTPTTGTIYTGPVAIGPATTTLKAIAHKPGLANSDITSRTYNFQTGAPVFTPGEGTYFNAQNVTISSVTNGAQIRYTTDGSEPTPTSGTIYAGPVSVSVTTTLKAIAYTAGFADSTVTAAEYTIELGVPVYTPVEGEYNDTVNVTITSPTTTATIRYTTDGSDPTPTSGTIYAGPVAISDSTNFAAIAYISETEFTDVAYASYHIQTATPTFSPPEGSYPNAQNVTITTVTSGAEIRYTTDGSDPTSTNGTVYTSPVLISESTTLKAIAYKTGIPASEIGLATYNIKVGSPFFNPPPSTYPGTQNITISTVTSGATIRYTTDGSEPSPTHGTIYTGAAAIGTTSTLKAIAYKAGSQDSDVVSGDYTIDNSFALILDDTFTDGDRAEGADALDSQWRFMTNVAPTTATVVNGALKLERTTSTSVGFNPHAVTTFPSQTLAVGQTITLRFDFKSLGNAGASSIRFGLYNSGGTNLGNDIAANPVNPGTVFQNDRGYSVFAPHQQTGNITLYYRPTNTTSNTLQLAAGANTTVVASGPLLTATDTSTTYQASLAISRLNATQFNIAVNYAGTSFNGNFTPAALTETFDTLSVFAITAQNQAFTLDNVRVTLSPPPVPPNTLVAWRTLQGLAADGSQDLLNPSGDGVSNLLKYALNLAPNAGDLALPSNHSLANPNGTTVAELTGLPVLRLNGGSQAEFIYIRRKSSTSPGVGYVVEWSDGLGSWSANGSAAESTLPLDATWERVTVTDTFTTGQKPKRFAKLVVSTL